MATLQLGDHVGERQNRNRGRPGQHRVDHLVAAPEGDAHDIGAGLLLELLHEMREGKRERPVA